jgi:hypothetical protein
VSGLATAFGILSGRVTRTTQHGQALVILTADRLAHDGVDHVRPIGRIWRVQHKLASLTVGQTGEFIDTACTYALDFIALLREFAYRLLEATDPRET